MINCALHDLEAMSRALEFSGMTSMMKVEQYNRGFIAQRSQGAGI